MRNKITQTEFAKILVEEVLEKRFTPKKYFDLWESCGLDRFKLNDPDQIWKWYAKSTLHWGGVNDNIVNSNWQKLCSQSILADRKNLVLSISQMQHLACFANFTLNCPVEYKDKQFCHYEKCYRTENFLACPMPRITREIFWHRHHYKTSKIFMESAKRLLILNAAGKMNGDLNEVVEAIFNRYRNAGQNWKAVATDAFFRIFEGMANYPSPSKSLLMFISDMSMPFLGIRHWPNFDLSTLIPVDTHVQRLSQRFGFVESSNASYDEIKQAFRIVYPENPRSISFAMFLLGAEVEMNICTKEPKCGICKIQISDLYNACPYPEK